MAFLSEVFSKTAGMVRMATGGAGGRMALGATAGAATAAWNSRDYNDPNLRMGMVLRGAVGGAVAGAATRLVTPAIRYGKPGRMTTGMPVGLKMGVKGLSYAGSLTAFALRNPGLTSAGIAGVGGMYLASNLTGGETSSLNYDLGDRFPNNVSGGDQALSMMNTGVSPMGNMNTGATARAARITNSTFGLVQGLNRGRHG